MTEEQLYELISNGEFPEKTRERKLVETHISWVILCDRFVYKIKKPIKYSFLDFSTPGLRKHYCERELVLNQRMSENIYLEVLPIREFNGLYRIGGNKGKVVDHSLKMRKLNPQRQMDVLVSKNKVGAQDIKSLAKWIADFHKSAKIIYKVNVLGVRDKFNDLALEKEFLNSNLDTKSGKLIEDVIDTSDAFLKRNKPLMEERLKSGFFKDVHGDLHTRNIFLLPEPQPFDCIEFNDDYRQIDVLNEVAFLCMDLDALGRKDLSEVFIKHYNSHSTSMRNENERQLFIYYKCYRANVRAKVNSLRAKSATDKQSKTKALSEARKYLKLMASYFGL